MQEGDIIPLTGEPTRREHVREMNLRETLDHSLIFGWNLCRIFSTLKKKYIHFIHSLC